MRPGLALSPLYRGRTVSETALHDAGGGNLYQPIATPSRGSSDLVLVRALKEHGASSVAHRHDREEVIWVLAGRAWAQIERRTVEMGPGDALIVAAGDLHRVENRGPDRFECIVAKPAGIRFLDATGESCRCPAGCCRRMPRRQGSGPAGREAGTG
jgi:quercetin dioxygenase-like cupin family protein